MITMEGIAQECATFQTANTLSPGIPCKLIAKMSGAPCHDGDEFIGVAARQDGTLCSVIFRGFVTLPFSGTTPSYGYVGLRHQLNHVEMLDSEIKLLDLEIKKKQNSQPSK